MITISKHLAEVLQPFDGLDPGIGGCGGVIEVRVGLGVSGNADLLDDPLGGRMLTGLAVSYNDRRDLHLVLCQPQIQ